MVPRSSRPALAAAAAALLCAATVAPAARAADRGEPLERGAALLGDRSFTEAAEAFAEALKADPSSEPARRGLGEAWASLGVAHLHAGRLAQAREALETAVATRPESAAYRRLLAQVAFRQGDLRTSRREVDEALDLDPGDPAARELSGDIHDKNSRLNLALAEWEAAAKPGGSPALAEKIERARREIAAESGMERESSRYFLLLFEPEVPRAVVKGMLGLLDEAFDVLHDRFGEYPRDEIKVILYSTRSFRDVTRSPDWVGGSYDGKIRIPVGGLATVQEAAGLKNILVHEMTHAFLFRMAPVGLPLWFQEGLATAFQGWQPAMLRPWLAERAGSAPRTLAEIDRALQGRGGDVTAGYAAARLAVNELEELRGFGAIRRIVAGVGAGEPFAGVFEDEMRLGLDEFEERWRRALP